MILGREAGSQKIGAVCQWSPLLEKPDDFVLQVVAVALGYRRQKGLHAREAISEATARIAIQANAAGYDHLAIWAKIDYRNIPSKRMCANAGFREKSRNGNLELWLYYRSL